MKHASARLSTVLIGAALLAIVTVPYAQQLPPGVKPADLATNNKLFLELARKGFKWEEPAEPVNIVPT